MQAGMASFHSSYNEQYHQPVMQQFDSLYANLGAIRSDVDSLSNQFGHLSTSVQHIQQQFMVLLLRVICHIRIIIQ
jgi:hypothetical protein